MKALIEEKLLLYKVVTKKDSDAFAKLYDFYIEPIYRFVFFKLSNREDAEDITSEVFLKTWDYLIEDEDKEINSFRQLVYTIARNRVVDVYRERARRQECSIETVRDVATVDDINDKLQQNQSTEQLLSNIKKLKVEYQEVIQLRYVEGLPIKDIAAILNKKSTNVRIIIFRAKKKLKELSQANSQ